MFSCNTPTRLELEMFLQMPRPLIVKSEHVHIAARRCRLRSRTWSPLSRLRRYARVLTGNPVRADDLVQDALLRAWDKRRLWQVGSDLRAWLFTIMHNIFVNQRALARRDGQGVSIDAEEDGGVVWQIAVRPTQQARVELIEVMHEIERLPAEQREVLLLAAVEELRYEEIATVLGIRWSGCRVSAPAPLRRVAVGRRRLKVARS
jgi:RNA polymerase sigma-70 factor (ECF subfamily)